MSMLAGVTRGKIKRAKFIIVYGVDGVGKTSLAADAPNPVFLGAEKGTDQLDVNRFPQPKKWVDVTKAVQELLTQPHDFKTLVVDTLDWLEPLVWQDVCERSGVKSIELANGGYGKGYTEALTTWNNFRLLLERLRDERKMNIVLLGHTEIENFTDPTNEQNAYQRYVLKLHKKAAALWREAADAVFFAHYVVLKKEDKIDKKMRYFDEDRRVLYTERRAGWDAKNRYGLRPQIDLKWSAIEEGIERGATQSAGELSEKITLYLEEILDPEVKEKAAKAFADASTDVRKLSAISERLSNIIEEQGNAA